MKHLQIEAWRFIKFKWEASATSFISLSKTNFTDEVSNIYRQSLKLFIMFCLGLFFPSKMTLLKITLLTYLCQLVFFGLVQKNTLEAQLC